MAEAATAAPLFLSPWNIVVGLWILLTLLAALLLTILLVVCGQRRRNAIAPALRQTKCENAGSSPIADAGVAAETPSFKAAASRPGLILPVDVMNVFEPLNLWTDDELTVLAFEHPSEIFPPESVLFQKGQPVLWGYYLLRGEVELVHSRAVSFTLRAQDVAARFLLGCGEHYPTDCVARTEIEVLRLPRNIALASDIAAKQHLSGIDTATMRIPRILAGSSPFYVFCRTFESRQLRMPTLPSVAMRLRDAMRKRDMSIETAAKIVQTDPVTTAKLIQVANSPLYFSSKRIASCQSAIARLGMDATFNLVVGIGVRGLFRSKNNRINRLMADIWHKSVHVSVLASVLAAEVGYIEPDHALLAGLIYRIGAIPFLNFVEHLPVENYTFEEVETAIPLLAGPVGKLVLTEWDFPDEYLALPLLAEDWFVDTGGGFNLSDLLRLAVWHSYLGEQEANRLPPIVSLPSYAKLKQGELTPEFSLSLLQRAKSRIDETSRVLMH